MIVFNGERWIVPKYKITRQIVTYDDNPELYPDSTSELVVLTPEQQARLDEVMYSTQSQDDIERYVFEGTGAPPDDRTDIEKLLTAMPADVLNSNVTTVVNLVDPWYPDIRYSKGRYVTYLGILYKTIQAHKSQADWSPDKTPALYAKVLTDPSGAILPWVQPLGAHDAYNMPGSGLPKSDPVTHNSKTWTSSINANVWAPGVYGWIETQ